MSSIPWCTVGSVPSEGDGGKETSARHSWKEESERTSWKLVSLRVPGTVNYKKSSSVPDVIRICQEPYGQKRLRKKFRLFSFVIVPEPSELCALQQSSEAPESSCVPSIKRCSLDEIEALKSPPEKINMKNETEWGRTHRKMYKTPVGHFPGTPSIRTGITT